MAVKQRVGTWCAGALLWALITGAAAPELAVVSGAFSQFEDGPATPASFEFVPGETVFLRFQVSGFKSTGGDDPRIRLTYRAVFSDPEGVAIVEPASGKVDAELAPQDKEWLPKIRLSALIPPAARSGRYRVEVAVKDEVAGSAAAATLQFGVRGRDVEPSETLVTRNFRFLRGEEDTNPLAVAAYRPGDTLWARFEMTGYKFAEKNRFEVEYGLAVLRASGDQLYEQPVAAQEAESSFYPRRHVTCTLSLNLDKDVRPGEYAILLRLRDEVGKQSHESRHVFRVE